MSVNGSSATGHCSSVATGRGADGSLSRCDAPTSSVLFDGNIPTLTGLDGDMWASQLLTFQPMSTSLSLVFDFTTLAGFSRVLQYEVVMFNCPEKGIGVQTITTSVQATESDRPQSVGGFINRQNTFCASLVRVCVSASIFYPFITLQFSPGGSDWVHLAEVTLLGNTRPCTSGPITMAMLPTTTMSDPATIRPQAPTPRGLLQQVNQVQNLMVSVHACIHIEHAWVGQLLQ